MARDLQAALVALNRFGLGGRGGSSANVANVASDPRGFVKAELDRPGCALLEAPGLKSTAELGDVLTEYGIGARKAHEAQLKLFAMQKAAASEAVDQTAAMTGPEGGVNMAGNVTPPNPAALVAPKMPNVLHRTYRAEALARLQRATTADCGFVERLVMFWSNHFCVSVDKGEGGLMWAGSFEREAIRPHVFGRFGDMLKAVEQHPAMLFFLDNQRSLGPDSRAGNRGRGLNENLAREIMELHTLGVGGGYGQHDVTSLAHMITGWTFERGEGGFGPPGRFLFNPNTHQPGPQRLLGKTYQDTGVSQAEAALADLARHPSTARFIARKFARHFAADDPPPALVARLQQVFGDTDGDLRALAETLLESDEAWQTSLTKIRSPNDFLIAASRLEPAVPDDPMRYLSRLDMLGQPLWQPSGPNGFPDTNDAWATPGAIKLRLEVAAQISWRLSATGNARDLLEVAVGDAASRDTRRAVERADSSVQGLILLLMSPEFQRR